MITTTAIWVLVAATTMGARLADRVREAQRDERGSPTLETVVIAAGLMAAAVGLVVVIKMAVTNYAAQIR